MEEKRPVGRPRKNPDYVMVPLCISISPHMRARLDAMAKAVHKDIGELAREIFEDSKLLQQGEKGEET